LRFRNNISASGVVATYSNPFSMSCVASLALVVALHVHSSDVAKYRADSRLMYTIVLSMFLCPRTVFTWIMSFVL